MPFQKGNTEWAKGDTPENREKSRQRMLEKNPMKDVEIRKKVSETVKEQWKDPDSVYNLQEYREKLKKRKNNLGTKYSKEARQKISEAAKKRKGPLNPAWTGGKPDWWRAQIIPIFNSCSLCHSDYKLEMHHRDEDREHNERSNLFMLCKLCHDFWHKN